MLFLIGAFFTLLAVARGTSLARMHRRSSIRAAGSLGTVARDLRSMGRGRYGRRLGRRFAFRTGRRLFR
jgi:hypothetical protein